MSVLLPKSKEEFSKVDYWNSFFKARGSKAFEWYGEYSELFSYLHKYIKVKDNILIPGCGNSNLGQSLYDAGFRDIINVDISPIVIKQMKQKVGDRANLIYQQMDVLNTTFENEKFNVVLDKGTLDALMPDSSQETVGKIIKYFDEIQRVTKFMSRFVCISLLQEHILTIILDYFPKNNWMVRIIRCFEAEQAAVNNGESLVPVFMVICTKFKTLTKPLLEAILSSKEKVQKFENVEQLKSAITSNQQAVFLCNNLQHNTIDYDNEISFQLYEKEDGNPKYTVYVVDIPVKKENSQYAAFIVPQGRESEWMFSTKEGRRKLASISKHNRLLVVAMHRNQSYESFEKVQQEISQIIVDLTPSKLKNSKVPCLTVGVEGIGQRLIIHEGISDKSGKYVIEDVDVDGEKFRRLYFSSNQFVIQSEGKLKSYKNKKKITKEVIDLLYLTCKHHFYMILGTFVACNEAKDGSCAVIGVGGGGLCSFLNKFLPDCKISGIEIDPEIIQIAKSWFGLEENSKLNIQVEDGLKYIQELSDKGNKLNSILFDVDNKDSSIGMSCPPKEFMEETVLSIIKNILTENGLFILNMVVRDESLKPKLVESLTKKFEEVISYKLEDELNEIFICCPRKNEILKDKLEDAAKVLNQFLKKHNHTDLAIDVVELKSKLIKF